MAEQLHVEVEPWGPDPGVAEAAALAALERPAVQAALGGAHARLLTVEPLEAPDETLPPERVRATVYDYAAEQALLVDLPLDGGEHPAVATSARQPTPTNEEREEALEILRADPELGPALSDGRLVAYRPMPPLLDDELPDGTMQRTVTVGLHPAGDDAEPEIVGVRLGRREVVRFDAKAPPAGVAACPTPASRRPRRGPGRHASPSPAARRLCGT